VGVIVEGAGDQHIKARVPGLPCRGHQIGPGHRAELRADEDARPPLLAVLLLHIAPFGANVIARPTRERAEADTPLFVGLLHPSRAQILQDHLGKVDLTGVFLFLILDKTAFDRLQLIVLVHGQHPMGRKGLHCERPRHPHGVALLVGPVEELLIGPGRNRGVHTLLAGDTLLPPGRVKFSGRGGPTLPRLSGNLPLLPRLAQRPVDLAAQRFQHRLKLLPDGVDLCVVGDVFEHNVGHPLIDKAVADVAVGGRSGKGRAADLRLFPLPGRGIGQQVIGVARSHDAGAGQSQGHPAGVNRDPATSPLLGRIGRGAAAAGGVEDEIAGVGGHEDATFNHLCIRLNNIYVLNSKCALDCICPHIVIRSYWEIIGISFEC
jgi:hypothetical protein